MQEKRKEQRHARESMRRANESASQELADERVNIRYEGRNEETALPFAVDSSHKVIVCGGYAGCTKCGAVCSVNTKRNALKTACRGYCPKGSQSAVKRLSMGKHPRKRHGSWPSFVENPTPKRLRV